MERELVNKIFFIDDYCSKNNMEEHIKEYIRILKIKYPDSIITKEFFKGSNIMVRVIQRTSFSNAKTKNEKQEQLIKEEIRIKEKGTNGLGENVYSDTKNIKSREIKQTRGGTERKRGGRE